MYKVDHKRVNEFGFSGEMVDEANKQVALVPPGDSSQTTTEAIKSDAEKKTD